MEVPLSSSLVPHSSPAISAAVAAAAAASLPVHNPRARKLRSAVWNDFTKERRPDGSFVAVCNHCQKQLTASSRSGTTHLRNHLAICLSTKPRNGPGRRKKLLVRRLLAPHGPRQMAVWNEFTKERCPDRSFVAVCNHCQKQLTASSRSGTTHLRKHLVICLSTKPRNGPGRRKKLLVRRLLDPYGPRKLGSNILTALDPNDPTSSLPDGTAVLPFNQEASRRDLARMIVRHGYRFSMVDDIGFRTFVHNLQPQFKMVQYDTVKDDCMRIYESAKGKLQDSLARLPSRVSLSVDTWRSGTGAEYLCLTCHFIEQLKNSEWKLCKKILNFIQIEPNPSPDSVSNNILEKIHEWGLEKKLSGIILDNCTAGDLIGREIIRVLSPKGCLLSNGKLFLMRSCAHILNLTVQESLEQAVEFTSWVRECIHHVKFTQDKFLEFQKICKQLGLSQKPLILDSPNNWSTTYSMFETACYYQDVFASLAKWDPDYHGLLNTKNWADVKALTDILDVLYHITEKFPATENATSNLYFNELCGIHHLLKTWCTSDSPVVATMASQMLLKLETYWDLTKTLMAIASILDPRFKMKSIEYFFKKIYGETFEAKSRVEEIQKVFINLYNEYALETASSSKNPAVLCYAGNTGSSVTLTGSGLDYNNGSDESKTFSRATLSNARRGLDQYIQDSSTGQSLKTDLDMYLEEPVYRAKEEGEFDILGWWRSFSAKYPVLSVMARDVLAVPVSAVPLDSDARLLNDYLSTMDSNTVQGLICAQDWLRDEPEVLEADVAVLAPSINADACTIAVQGEDYSASPK